MLPAFMSKAQWSSRTTYAIAGLALSLGKPEQAPPGCPLARTEYVISETLRDGATLRACHQWLEEIDLNQVALTN
jgi:hypothetical protein